MEKHQAIAERAFALMNGHNVEQLKTVLSGDCHLTMPGMPPMRGPEAFGQVVQGWISAFPDIKHEITGYVEEGDRAAWRVRVTATHTGTLQTPTGPLPATGKRIKIDALDIAHFHDGRAVSWHVYFDQLAFLQQLGLGQL